MLELLLLDLMLGLLLELLLELLLAQGLGLMLAELALDLLNPMSAWTLDEHPMTVDEQIAILERLMVLMGRLF